MTNLGAFFSQGLTQLGLHLSQGQRETLLAYVQLLHKWNRVYNLTAVRDPRAMVIRHLFDSLAVVPYVRGPRIADVGSGAGLPGIPLAIALPQCHFTLIDSAAKRARFMTQAVVELQLTNVEVVQSRVEDFRPEALFDSIISRAFASLRDMLEGTVHLCAQDGVFLALKGAYPEAELRDLPDGFTVGEVVALNVPELHAERHLVRLLKN